MPLQDRADPDDAKPSQEGPEPVEKVEPAVGMQALARCSTKMVAGSR